MNLRIATVAFAVVAAATGHIAAQMSQQPKAYTADWVMSGTPMPMNMHISKNEDKQRIDMEMPTMSPGTMQFYICPQSTIVRPDLKKVYIVTHFKKEYEEKELNPKLDMSDPRTEATKVEELGSESVDGEDCTKYRLSMEQGAMLMWVSKKTNMMRKMAQEGNSGFAMEVKNLEVGAPPAATFEIPADYKKVGGTGTVAKGVFAGMGAGMASAFMPNFVGGAAAAAQARAQQASMQADAAKMAEACKPAQMPGMPGMRR